MTIHYIGKQLSYWKVYHLSKKINGKELYNLSLAVASKLGSPWKLSNRGSSPTFIPTNAFSLS